MKVKILQGLNFESDISVVKIECDEEPDTRVIDLVKSYHDVFLRAYSVEGNTVSIESRLPHIWRESADAINKLSTGEWDYDRCKNYILNTVIKGQVYSMSTIPILEAAHKLGYETNQVFFHNGIDLKDSGNVSQWNRYYRIGVGRMSGISVSAGSNRDPIVALKTQRDKKITNTLVSRMYLPMAKWEPLESEEHLEEVFDDYEKPVVIKPTGLTQGHGVTTNIFDLEHAKRAYRYAKEMLDAKLRPSWQQGMMIQKQVRGDDYRLLVINGKLEVATKRVPAFVVGDGKSTIRELIEQTNTDPRRDMENPAHILKPIQFDKPLDEFLAEQNLSLDTVPGKDKRIYVRKVASMSQGGITEDFTDKVHPQIKYLAESVASSIHANVVGIDVICLDISKPLTSDNGSFIEMNTMPETYLNAFPVLGKQHPDLGEKVLEGFLSGCEPVKKIVAVGGTLDELNAYLEEYGYYDVDERTGVLSAGAIYINQELMNDEIPSIDHGVRAIKLNALLSNIIIHYKDFDEVREHGFGFDRFDLLLSDKTCEATEELVQKGSIGEILSYS